MKDARGGTEKYDWENADELSDIPKGDYCMPDGDRKSETSEPTCYEKINGIDYQNQ